MLLPTRILALPYRTNARCLDLPKRRLYQRCSGRIKAAWSVVRDAFGNLLTELNTELVKGVYTQQSCVNERTMLVKAINAPTVDGVTSSNKIVVEGRLPT